MPTTKEIYENIIAQIEAETGASVPLPKRAFTRVVASAVAAIFSTVWKYAQWILLQYYPRTASSSETQVLGNTIIPLEELGVKNGTGYRKTLTTAEYDTVTESTGAGATISAGATLTSSLSGLVFTVVADTLPNPQTFSYPGSNPTPQSWQIVRVRASVAGSAGALPAGESLVWDSQPTDTTGNAFKYETVAEGTDDETWDDYRARVAAAEANTPQGGAYYDYYRWASEVEGVADVFPYTSATPGWVDVYVAGPDNTAVSAGVVTLVENAIEFDDAGLATRRPAGARVNVQSITTLVASISVGGLTSPDLATSKTNIETAARDYLRGLRPYIEGLTQPPRRDVYRSADLQSAMYAAATADGATFSSISVSGLGASGTTMPEGVLYDLGSIAWV